MFDVVLLETQLGRVTGELPREELPIVRQLRARGTDAKQVQQRVGVR